MEKVLAKAAVGGGSVSLVKVVEESVYAGRVPEVRYRVEAVNGPAYVVAEFGPVYAQPLAAARQKFAVWCEIILNGVAEGADSSVAAILV